MAPTLAHVTDVAQTLWPLSGAESWDAPGLIAGDPSAEVAAVHLAVDAVAATADEALELGAQLLLVHHPLLLRGVTSVAEDRYKGAVISRLIRGGCALLAAHTNADVVADGTSAVLARALGLRDVRPIVPSASAPALGLGRMGELPEPVTLGELARGLQELLPATAQGIRGAGDYFARVQRIALCAGAGDSLLAHPEVLASEVYVTSDLRHHPASEARENARIGGGPALLDISHWAAEWLWLDVAAEQLRAALPGVTVTVSELRTDPWDFALV
ncbi:Nif3-like dinuclear metal center hexameric protein [Protaetiibacter intestinalis]|uniref:GTP cyclohydrolase 1 type 2 homolog n=1 Tax=Protaetiibacter intestinalis TaxID=2419774 RepID=A0A387B5R4_9MICO|nr:Nif3-like dinuclear metal center hexameric protein [Protaetiibacter intestinalis]AYF98972.1 Nif3-like dinuclear metal center hexameric protein [Protaetiibacter intestinalis]